MDASAMIARCMQYQNPDISVPVLDEGLISVADLVAARALESRPTTYGIDGRRYHCGQPIRQDEHTHEIVCVVCGLRERAAAAVAP